VEAVAYGPTNSFATLRGNRAQKMLGRDCSSRTIQAAQPKAFAIVLFFFSIAIALQVFSWIYHFSFLQGESFLVVVENRGQKQNPVNVKRMAKSL
jgi:hypothetical protein